MISVLCLANSYFIIDLSVYFIEDQLFKFFGDVLCIINPFLPQEFRFFLGFGNHFMFIRWTNFHFKFVFVYISGKSSSIFH